MTRSATTLTLHTKAIHALLGSDDFKEMAAIVNAGGPSDAEKIKAVMLKHGLVPVMPHAASR